MRRAAVSTVVFITACSVSGSNDRIVTEPVHHLEVDLAIAGDDLAAAAPDYVLASGDLGLSEQDELAVLASARGLDGLRHARLQQVHASVPVLGSEVMVHADDSTFLGYNGFLTRNLDGFDTAPALGEEEALAIAIADRGAGIDYARQQARLVILPRDEADGADLVWQVELYNDGQEAADAGRWWYFVAAADGAIVRKYDGLTTLAQASGPGGNARVARTWSAALDVEEEAGGYVMKTARQVTLDLANQRKGGEPVRAAALDGFADPVANDAHGFTEITLDMLRDWVGTDSIDGNGFTIVARVHYGKDFDLASWDGEHTNFGDSKPGERFPRPGGLDVVAHETNHGYTEKHADLVYADQPGALNESFSDVAGTMAEFFHEGEAADFDIAEDIYMTAGDAHRSMCDPSARGDIDHMSDYFRGLGVHVASGIGNKAFCLAVGRFKALSGGATADAVRRAGLAWYAANASYWTSTTRYAEACQGIIDGARSLGYSSEEVAAIHDSWADVGVMCDSGLLICNQDGTCDPTDGETCASCPADCGTCSDECNWFTRAKCALGLGDCSRCDLPAGCGDGVCSDDETDASCGEDCGCASGDTCSSVAPYGCYCDGVCQLRGDCCADYLEVCPQ